MSRSFKLKPTTAHESFGEETVIVSLDSGSYYSVLGVGSIIFSLVADGATEADVLGRVKSRFSGSSDEISDGVAKFLDQLVKESLVDAEQAHDGDGEQAGGETGQPEEIFSAPLLQKYTDMEEMLVLDPIHEVDDYGWPSARPSLD
jgi:hypothetical protein